MKVSYCSKFAHINNNTPGDSKRTGEDFRKKIDDILVYFSKATDFLNATGQGILNNNPGCHEQQELETKKYAKALVTNESDNLEKDSDGKNDDRLILDDEESVTNCTSTGTNDFMASIE